MIAMQQRPGAAMVEVFRTNILSAADAARVTDQLLRYFPGSRVDVDLDDCDKVLRVEGRRLETARLRQLVCQQGFECELLD